MSRLDMPPEARGSGPRPLGAWRGAGWWAAAVLALGGLLFCYRYLGGLAEGEPEPFVRPLVDELSGALAAGVLFWPVRSLVRRRPLRAGNLLRRLPLYLAGLLAFATIHTCLMWGQRLVLYPLLGQGAYDYGRMPLRYVMEAPMQAIGFAVTVAALHAIAALRASRERELRAARLESSLAQARLAGLRQKLQPHFLFNALNTVSATMYDDPAAADQMLEHLAELLRAALGAGEREEVGLGEELALLDRYLALLRARFGPRLEVEVSVPDGLAGALVPPLLLQPLVENAVRHGGVERVGRGRITVRAWRAGDDAGAVDRGRVAAGMTAGAAGTGLVIEVADDGLPDGSNAAALAAGGVGLTATAERLELLYGPAHRFTAGPISGGGFVVRIELPLRLVGPGLPAGTGDAGLGRFVDAGSSRGLAATGAGV